MDSPRRFSDLSWSAGRATEWAARAAALWSELLEALASKPGRARVGRWRHELIDVVCELGARAHRERNG